MDLLMDLTLPMQKGIGGGSYFCMFRLPFMTVRAKLPKSFKS